MVDLEKQLRAQAKKLLEDKAVDCVIGYENSDDPLMTTPCFITAPNEVDRLVLNCLCGNNLTKYLIGRKEKTAVVAKAWDVRSVAVLVKENQVKRENVIIIGVPSLRIVDQKKIIAHLNGKEVISVILKENAIEVQGDVFSEDLLIDDYLQAGCELRDDIDDSMFDIVIGEMPASKQNIDDDDLIKQLEAMSSEQRWEFFKKEFSKCIRCYACREACPLCYCKSCFVDQNFPAWFSKSTDLSDNMSFHIIRALHAAGRCTDCGACFRACPNDINLRVLNRKIAKDIKELFDSEPGLNPKEDLPLTSYKPDDPQDFIK
ncbi:MAG: 4Fe-4S dicluster domain-containing protein [Phycisphaerae bacterium]